MDTARCDVGRVTTSARRLCLFKALFFCFFAHQKKLSFSAIATVLVARVVRAGWYMWFYSIIFQHRSSALKQHPQDVFHAFYCAAATRDDKISHRNTRAKRCAHIGERKNICHANYLSFRQCVGCTHYCAGIPPSWQSRVHLFFFLYLFSACTRILLCVHIAWS